MNLDGWLLIALAFAAFFRYHRSEIAKAEERFEKCDSERVRLHTLCYKSMAGVDFTDVKKAEGAIVAPPAPQLSPEEALKEKYREEIERTKLQLRRMARRRPSDLGKGLRQVERRNRPQFKTSVRPAMDPVTAKQVADDITRQFADIREQVNARTSQTGG